MIGLYRARQVGAVVVRSFAHIVLAWLLLLGLCASNSAMAQVAWTSLSVSPTSGTLAAMNGTMDVVANGSVHASFGDAVTTVAEPNKVVPVASKASGLGKQFSYSFAPYSVTVLVLSTK